MRAQFNNFNKKRGHVTTAGARSRYGFFWSPKITNLASIMNGIFRFLLSGLAVVLSAYLLPGVHVEHYGYALLVALVLTVVNWIIKPILIVLTIPITVLTLGLFLLVINALMILLVDYLVPGFSVDGFWWALAFSLILSLFNSLFTDITEEKK
jgi:putative membrane protein